MSIPDGATDSFYFQMRAHRSHAWAAIGLGSDDMPGSLVLMMYDSSDESNVTFSPRVAHGHREPEYFADMEYHLYGGTGIYDQHMVVTGICTRNCLSWRAGDTSAAIDITNESEGAIYALGPLAGFNSDNPRSSVQFHVQYGSFNMNMSEARGATVPLAVDLVHTKTNDGTVLNRKWIRKADVLAVVHAVCMVMAFVLIMPLGAVMLRLGQSVRWHALTQTSALVIVIVGFGVGVATSLRYQRVSLLSSLYSPLHGRRCPHTDLPSSPATLTRTTKSSASSSPSLSSASSASASTRTAVLSPVGPHGTPRCTLGPAAPSSFSAS